MRAGWLCFFSEAAAVVLRYARMRVKSESHIATDCDRWSHSNDSRDAGWVLVRSIPLGNTRDAPQLCDSAYGASEAIVALHAERQIEGVPARTCKLPSTAPVSDGPVAAVLTKQLAQGVARLGLEFNANTRLVSACHMREHIECVVGVGDGGDGCHVSDAQ